MDPDGQAWTKEDDDQVQEEQDEDASGAKKKKNRSEVQGVHVLARGLLVLRT